MLEFIHNGMAEIRVFWLHNYVRYTWKPYRIHHKHEFASFMLKITGISIFLLQFWILIVISVTP